MSPLPLLLLSLFQTAAPPQAAKPAPPPVQATGRPATVADAPSPWYAPLLNYDGTWQMKSDDGKIVTVENDCVRTGEFVECEQKAGDQQPSLLVFRYAGEPGRYYSTPVLQDSKTSGRGDLTIDGNLWTYSSEDTNDGKTTYHRVVNEFSDGNERIKFRVESSPDGKTWKTEHSGVETMMHH